MDTRMMFPALDTDVSLDVLKSRKIGLIGYGNQARAQAFNIRDSKFGVTIGLRAGSPHRTDALKDGFNVVELDALVRVCDLIMFLIPDSQHAAAFSAVASNLRLGQALGFAHGYTMHYKQLMPPPFVDVFLAAPKGVGEQLRRLFVQGSGVPVLIGVAQDVSGHALNLAAAYAKALGGGRPRAGIYLSSFAEETEADLFTEQVLICGGVSELLKKSFEVLLEFGFPPEAAYFETVNELKLLVDLIHERGIAGMYEFTSPTAQYGGLTRGPRVVNDAVKDEMRRILTEIQSGDFAREFADASRAAAVIQRLLAEIHDHPISQTREKLVE
ncbi:MAG: ketol-acid reductoisomerase [bacterium]